MYYYFEFIEQVDVGLLLVLAGKESLVFNASAFCDLLAAVARWARHGGRGRGGEDEDHTYETSHSASSAFF